MKMGNINVYSKVVRRSTCGGLGTDNWLWGILKPRTNANGNLEKKKMQKQKLEPRCMKKRQMQKEIWKSFKDETKCLFFSSSTNMKMFGDG